MYTGSTFLGLVIECFGFTTLGLKQIRNSVKSPVKPTWSEKITVLRTFFESSLNFLFNNLKILQYLGQSGKIVVSKYCQKSAEVNVLSLKGRSPPSLYYNLHTLKSKNKVNTTFRLVSKCFPPEKQRQMIPIQLSAKVNFLIIRTPKF